MSRIIELTDLVAAFDKKVAARIVLVGMLLQKAALDVVEPFVARHPHFLEKPVRDWPGCLRPKTSDDVTHSRLFSGL